MTITTNSTSGRAVITTATAVLLLALTATQTTTADAPDGWIQGARDDAERFERIERYLGGFSRSMWEVGERYARIHEALDDGNYALAQYHWDKIRATIENGYLKRPGRRKNADAILLDSVWPTVADKLDSGDAADAWNGFEQARAACMACHVAEEVEFMNDQPLFRTLRAPDGD